MKYVSSLLLSLFALVSLISFPHLTYQQQYNPRLERAYAALQAWKQSFTCDPSGTTSDWDGLQVCNYTGVYCAPAPDDPNVLTVAGIDLNHASICGYLHEDLGLLTDLAILHLNTNSFYGTIPDRFRSLSSLYELDLSNNRLSGLFPSTVLYLPVLKYLDLRYNSFFGKVPSDLFDMKSLDAIFLNNNDFLFSLPENLGNYKGSVLVLANTNLLGCIPRSIARTADTLVEILLINTGLSSCIPPEIGSLHKLTVFDVSENRLVGQLPETIGQMESLEQLNVASNLLTGGIPDSICELPSLKNLTYSDNYFTSVPNSCSVIRSGDAGDNCIFDRLLQRPKKECIAFLSKPPIHCGGYEGSTCWEPQVAYLPPNHHN